MELPPHRQTDHRPKVASAKALASYLIINQSKSIYKMGVVAELAPALDVAGTACGLLEGNAVQS
jgi:hypothetical protein